MTGAERSVTLRPELESDRAFVAALYASTREEELAQVEWPPGAREAFLAQQFAAQHSEYRANYPGASFDLIVLDGEPVGRLYVHRRAEEIRVMDLALLPHARRAGTGTIALGRVLEEARRTGLPVTIHVERFNRALSFYERLGFRLREDRGVYLFLEWRPEADAGAEASCSTG